MQRKIKCRILDAKYFEEQRSIALSLEEWETHRPVKTAQISASSFTFGGKDVNTEMNRLAELYKRFKYPISIIEDTPDPEPETSNIELPEPWMIPFFGSKGK